MKDKNIAVIGGRGAGKSAIMLEQAAKEIKHWQDRYNEVAVVNNRHVEIIQGLLEFLQLQSGILYTTITGDTKCDRPLEKLSAIQEAALDENAQDLNFMRNSIITFTSELMKQGDLEAAKQAWTDFINNNIKGGTL